MFSKTKIIALTVFYLLPCLAFADFKLSDFAGSYIASSSSAGGVTAPNPNNVATTTVAQFKLCRNGSGKISNLSVTNMVEAGNFQTTTFSNLVINIQLTDPIHGVGTIVVYDYPQIGANLSGTFVAKKAKKLRGGGVEKMFINLTGQEGSTAILRSASIIFAEKQN